MYYIFYSLLENKPDFLHLPDYISNYTMFIQNSSLNPHDFSCFASSVSISSISFKLDRTTLLELLYLISMLS